MHRFSRCKSQQGLLGPGRRIPFHPMHLSTRAQRTRSHPSPKTLTYKPRSKPPPPAPPKGDRLKYRRIPLFLAMTTVAGLSFTLTYIYIRTARDTAAYADTPIPADVSDRYDRTARRFDSDVDFAEWAMGLGKLRRELCAHATGHVLEASVGTGRNMTHLPLAGGGVKSVTMVDASREMLDVARAKWSEHNSWFIHAVFRHADARRDVPCPSPEGFDTVVQTMGLCSCAEPEALLRSLGGMTRPGGTVLLLEHGRGWYGWLNRWMDGLAPAHADRYGCWFNRDVEGIVGRSGLEVVERRRYHLGTTYWYILKPIEESRKKRDAVDMERKHGPVTSETRSGSWWSWWVTGAG